MEIIEEELANRLLLTLLNLTRHIANVSDEDTNIGSGIFILSIIDSRENCSMSNIVEDLNLVASTATRQVNTLVNLGLVKRDVGKKDRRKVILSLTQEGEEVNKRFKNHLIQVITNTLETHSQNDVDKAIEILNIIVENSENQLPL